MPLHAQHGGVGFEHPVGEVQTNHTMYRGAEIELHHLAARGPLDTRIFSGQSVACRQGIVIKFQNEIAAAILIGNHGAGDVVSTVRVGSRDQSPRRDDLHTWQA